MHIVKVVSITYEKGMATLQGNPIGATTGRLRRDRLVTAKITRRDSYGVRIGGRVRVS
jgi:hypothetical protein